MITSMGPKLATMNVAVPPVQVPLAHKDAAVPPVLVPLTHKVVQMSGEQVVVYAARIRDAFQLVKGQGHFPLAPNKQGALYATMQGVQSIVDALTVYHMLGLESEGKA